MRKTAVLLTVLGLGLATLFSATSSAPAQDDASGRVTLESTPIAVGVRWGDGVLEYRGQKYPFRIKGLSVMDVGVSKVTARGVVQNLNMVEDFGRSYVLAGTGASAVGGGEGMAALKNQNGVEMALTATGQGIWLSLPHGGVDVKLKQ